MMLCVSLLLVGLSCLSATANDVIDVAIGSHVTLPCHMSNTFNRCHWQHYITTIYSDHPADLNNPAGYAVIGNPNNGSCSLRIEAIKFDDNGEWNCYMPSNAGHKSMLLSVFVPPASNLLLVDDHAMQSGQIAIVHPHPVYGYVKVECISLGAKPAPTIHWQVDGIPAEADEDLLIIQNQDNQTVNASSTLTLQYPVFTQQNTTVYRVEANQTRQKSVRCVIGHTAYPNKKTELETVLGLGYATTKCELSAHHNQENNSYTLQCTADGVPEPEIVIQRTRPNSDVIELVFMGNEHTVTESGIYTCEATYQGMSVQSNQIVIDFNSAVEEETAPSSTSTQRTRNVPRGRPGFGNSLLSSASAVMVYSLVIITAILG